MIRNVIGLMLGVNGKRRPGLALALVLGWMITASTIEYSALAQSVQQAGTVERQIHLCFERGEYSKAKSLILEYLQHEPDDENMIYNLACAHSRLGEFDDAASALLQAFEAGFRDIDHMRRDPDLNGLREHPTYARILKAADKVGNRRAANAMQRWRDTYGEDGYRYETDEKHRLNFATALDEVSHAEMRAMLERQADQLISTLFEQPPSYYVLIAIPKPDDADRFFKNDRSIGGMYQHGLRRLVSRDIGSSLRHEFFHALHFGHMERIGQAHPLWMQEGLASLYEDYELSDDGSISFLPNDRQLIVKSRAKAGRLTPWKEIFEMSSTDFMEKAQHMYPTVRSMFEFVADHGKLAEWYRAYVEHFDEDRTGARAMEIVFAKPIAEVERSWRRWVAQQPAVNLMVRPESAALGIRTSGTGTNDGVLITEVVRGSAAARANLRRGDVIVAINDRSVRSFTDLRRIIAASKAGDEIQVRARRDGEYFTVTAIMRPITSG